MKLFGLRFELSARDKTWGFTAASEPLFIKGSDTGVLICHGFGGSPSNMRCLTEKAKAHGLTVSVPLLKGHAQTLGAMAKQGYKAWREDAEKAYRRLADNGCSRIYLCGLSMGALLMAELAARHADDARISGVMLICPPVVMRGYLVFLAHICHIAPYVLTAEGFNEDPDMEMYYGTASRKLWDIIRLAHSVKRSASGIKAPVTLIEAERDNRVHPRTYSLLENKLGLKGHTLIKDAPHGIPYSPRRGELCGIFEKFITE